MEDGAGLAGGNTWVALPLTSLCAALKAHVPQGGIPTRSAGSVPQGVGVCRWALWYVHPSHAKDGACVRRSLSWWFLRVRKNATAPKALRSQTVGRAAKYSTTCEPFWGRLGPRGSPGAAWTSCVEVMRETICLSWGVGPPRCR